MVDRIRSREPLGLFDFESGTKERVIPLDILAIPINHLVVDVQNHEKVAARMMKATGLIHAADEPRPAQ
jgi:hypothetical protein